MWAVLSKLCTCCLTSVSFGQKQLLLVAADTEITMQATQLFGPRSVHKVAGRVGDTFLSSPSGTRSVRDPARYGAAAAVFTSSASSINRPSAATASSSTQPYSSSESGSPSMSESPISVKRLLSGLSGGGGTAAGAISTAATLRSRRPDYEACQREIVAQEASARLYIVGSAGSKLTHGLDSKWHHVSNSTFVC
jgi:hypothetical protein